MKILRDLSMMRFAQRMKRKYGYDHKLIFSFIRQARLSKECLSLVNQPDELLPWHTYHKKHVTEARIKEGVFFWQKHKNLLVETEKRYQIPSSLIVAILGIESEYGRSTGIFPVLNSLVTLAFFYPPRRHFFLSQLEHFFVLIFTRTMDPLTVKGSYAGAMGICQFIPTSYLKFALSATNLKFSSLSFEKVSQIPADLFSNPGDAIVSVAHFLYQKGWRIHGKLLAPMDDVSSAWKQNAQISTASPQAPRIALNAVLPDLFKKSPEIKINLIHFQEEMGYRTWLCFWNFYVLTRYNNSYNYAMAVCSLSRMIEKFIKKSYSE